MPSSIQFPGTSGRPTRNRQKDDEGILGEGAILRLSREAGETLPTSHPLTVPIARAESHKSQVEGSHLGRPPPRTFLYPGEPPEAAERTVAVLPPQEVSHFATVRRLGAVRRRDLCSPPFSPCWGKKHPGEPGGVEWRVARWIRLLPWEGLRSSRPATGDWPPLPARQRSAPR
jgi:hypothetical protein